MTEIQNWMRDYDPTTGRYIQADPLGLVDGASVYGYALQNPGRYVDPRGEAVCGGVCVGGAGIAIGTGLKWVAKKLFNQAAKAGATAASSKVQKARERKADSTYCKTPPPKSGDFCEDLKTDLEHARTCLQMRKEFGDKWFGDGHHDVENQSWENRIKKLEEQIKDLCSHMCGELGIE